MEEINMKKLLKRNTAIIPLFLMSITLLLSACSNSSNSQKYSEVQNGKTTYPLKLTDSYGRKVTIDKKPMRIISIAPNITETIAALNASDRLVGRTDYCDYPKSITKVSSIGNITDPSLEKIVELKPDVVIASNMTNKGIITKLENLNIKVVVLEDTQSIDGTYDVIGKIGQIIDESDSANKIVSDMKKKIDMVASKVKNLKKVKVYYVISYGRYGDYTAGKNTYIDNLIQMAGGDNIAEDVTGWKYSLEKIIQHDPDIIICTKYPQMKLGFMKENGYNNLRAVREGKVFEINNDILNRQGPRMVDGLLELAKIIHPEAFK
jgi:iron complex transport system substrate-binding protein